MRQKRSIWAVGAALVATLSLGLAGCGGGGNDSGGESSESGGSAAPDASDMKIALLASAAGANDNGYNQTAIEGLEAFAEETGVDYKVVEATADYPGTLKTLAENGFQLIFSLEYDFTALIEGVGGEAPLAEQFPDTYFVVFNANPNIGEDGQPIHDNVISVMFNVNESSFLAGALAVQVIENQDVLFDSATHQLTPVPDGRKLGFIGGTQSDGITVFSDGYYQGIDYAAAELGSDVLYTVLSTFDAGFVDTAKGAQTAGTYYDQGANVVFTVAGSVADGVNARAKELKKLSIDVDADKDDSQPGYVLTSVLKNTNVPVQELGAMLLAGDLGSVGGTQVDYTLASGATGITDLSVIKQHIKQDEAAQAKWAEIEAYIADLSEKISSGEIEVSNAQLGEHLDLSTLTNVKAS